MPRTVRITYTETETRVATVEVPDDFPEVGDGDEYNAAHDLLLQLEEQGKLLDASWGSNFERDIEDIEEED